MSEVRKLTGKEVEEIYSKAKMTDKQQGLFDAFLSAFHACEEADVCFYVDCYGNVRGYNGEMISGCGKGRRITLFPEFVSLDQYNLMQRDRLKLVGVRNHYMPCFASDDFEGYTRMMNPAGVTLREDSEQDAFSIYKGTKELMVAPDIFGHTPTIGRWVHEEWEVLEEVSSISKLRDYLRDYFGSDAWDISVEDLILGLKYQYCGMQVSCLDRDEVLRIELKSLRTENDRRRKDRAEWEPRWEEGKATRKMRVPISHESSR